MNEEDKPHPLAWLFLFTAPPILGWISNWLSSFTDTWLAHKSWDDEAVATGIALGLLVVLAAVARFSFNWNSTKSCKMGRRFAYAAILMAAICIGLRIYVSELRGQSEIILFRDKVWKWAFVLFLLLAQATVTFVSHCVLNRARQIARAPQVPR